MEENQKVLTKRWRKVDPRELTSYRKLGGYEVLQRVLQMKPRLIIEEIVKSGLQGRGGGGFPTGKKWESAASFESDEKYFICNLDESEPGTYKDRLLAENDPHQLIEGIIIGSYAVGAKKAYIYVNGNFHLAHFLLERAVNQAYEHHFLGQGLMGSDYSLDIEIFVGAGAYICGEETALINSIEGKRGEPRKRPPYTSECGLFNKPTVVNNAETIASIPWIMEHGGTKYAQIGSNGDVGTKIFCIDGIVKNPGAYEVPMGTDINDLIFKYAGGIESGDEPWFAQIGGSAGQLVPPNSFADSPSYSRDANVSVGSGALLVISKNQDIKELMLSWMNFFQRESCGQCVPCREGTFRLKMILERLKNGNFSKEDKDDFHKLIWTLDNTTFCALGKFSAIALKDVVKYGFCKELE
ncbi:NADH-quinone oxidoreductase subunit F [bacterium]|jgi:NADH-quinone oxidoreductase subunit F|nr:NADH-quinone oxidoreductase subunit F [bacterium]MBT4251460.1 NADH-quinone oxidoreductase subunit F [bacterium]MBT4597434.1 NADH-quinone oxidoreductase subunit F [bacterium]MBT6754273.1 NADH-quinone oxidoreductase subunit F [bacterium]MBT7037599.1 NADH-quinone oxidoreductase subunit F [bacterium]